MREFIYILYLYGWSLVAVAISLAISKRFEWRTWVLASGFSLAGIAAGILVSTYL